MQKLNKGDTIDVVSPSSSSIKLGNSIELAKKKLTNMGYSVRFSENFSKSNMLNTSSIEDRINDLHTAFESSDSKAILTSIGGFSANQLLPYIDYELIKRNPKILCGYSDITVLLNAIYAKTGLVTFLGLHYSSFAMKKGFEYSENYFLKALTQNEPYLITHSEYWSDEAWFKDQENRNFIPTSGWKAYNDGIAEGELIGGNINSFYLLQGTEYLPSFENKIILLEFCSEVFKDASIYEFDRNLESLIQCKDFDKIKALVIGRFQLSSGVSEALLLEVLHQKPILKTIPVIYDFDIGHTTPMLTLPIGGRIKINTLEQSFLVYCDYFDN